MSALSRSIRAVVFDYGNTLVEFSSTQVDRCAVALGTALVDLFGPFDSARFQATLEANRLDPYRNGFNESGLDVITRALVRTLYRVEPNEEQVRRLVRTRREAFIAAIDTEACVHGVLAELAARYRLGLLSNYPCGESIRGSLDRTGLAAHLDAVVVSADVGFVKPHARTFETILRKLNVPADEVVFVGDNWFADVQGAKRAGMVSVLIRRWVPVEHFDRQAGDWEPDWVIDHLSELPVLLAGGVPAAVSTGSRQF